MLVDSTRAGKRMPDSFSKTVPIWCAVINRALKLKAHAPAVNDNWDAVLYTAPQSVSKQEHSQIEERLDAWATALAVSRGFVWINTRNSLQLTCVQGLYLCSAVVDQTSAPHMDHTCINIFPGAQRRTPLLSRHMHISVKTT